MGYVNTNLSRWVSPAGIGKIGGVWTDALAADVVSAAKAAAANAGSLLVPLELPQGVGYRNGAKIVSIDVWYTVGTAALNSMNSVQIEQQALPAHAAAVTGAAVAVTPDSAHASSGNRAAVGAHRMTLTPNADFYLSQNMCAYLSIAWDAAAGSALTLYGAQINYQVRE